MNFDIGQYISGADSICREERQYALYLNNVLLGIKKIKDDSRLPEILTACGLPQKAQIENVFYEAAFMRDLFNNDKTQFNHKLLEYICDPKRKFEGVPAIEANRLREMQEAARDFHLGAGKGQEQLKGYPTAQFVVRVMMNAKPDIAVIYHREEEKKKYLHFIECKYLSKEDKYDYGITQTTAQNWIAHFLCARVFSGLNPDEDAVSRVQFTSKFKTGKGISIATLIDLNNRIFQ